MNLHNDGLIAAIKSSNVAQIITAIVEKPESINTQREIIY
jgi:hypothetical protein